MDMFHLNKAVDIIQVDKGDGSESYTVQFEQGNAYYTVISDFELDGF